MRIKKDTQKKDYSLGILGKVKVGMKSEKGYPMSLDYFRFTSNQPSRVERIKALLGEKPTSIPITFYSNDINDVCSQRYELRNKSGQLLAFGDGEYFQESTKKGWVNLTKEGFKKLVAAPGNTWKEILILKFIILGYDEYGAWELRTGGKETSIKSITNAFDMVLEQAGRVTMIPFNLTMKKHKSNRAHANRQYPVIDLTADLGIEKQQKIKELGLTMTGQLLTAERVEQAALPAAETDDGASVFTDIEIVE